MKGNPQKTSLFVLGISALILTRAMLFFIDDPEGPNLIVVFLLALPVYILSISIYRTKLVRTFKNSTSKLLFLIGVQIFTLLILFFFLR